MSRSLLDRRTLLQSGMTVAGCLALAGLRPGTALAGQPATAAPVTGSVIGWTIIRHDGSGQLNIIQLDPRGHPERLIDTVMLLPMTSIATSLRYAQAAMVRTFAASWQVSARECVCQAGRIECRRDGRSVPFAIWTDFV
jgi:hypothetical protein